MSGPSSSFEDAIISGHAHEQLVARGIPLFILGEVLESPDSIQTVRVGRVVAQKVVAFEEGARRYLIRVFVDVDRYPPEVVTVYRTSKIRKYMGES